MSKNHKCMKILKISFASIAVMLAAAVLLVFVLPVFEAISGESIPGSEKWMADLNDGLKLNEISIPGTHDSATQYCGLLFFSKCQSSDIYTQLINGYRYLDIRLGAEDGRLKLMHGFTECRDGLIGGKLYLDGVTAQCERFLQENPSETVIFAVKHEHGDESTEEFSALLMEYISSNEELWYLGNDVPELGDVRGKIVLLRRYHDASAPGVGAGIEFDWANQNGSDDTALSFEYNPNPELMLCVQDRYEYDAADKWGAFAAGLKNAERRENGTVYLSFLSTKGTMLYGHPYHFAKLLNRKLLNSDLTDFAGWVITDFSDASIAQHIYALN